MQHAVTMRPCESFCQNLLHCVNFIHRYARPIQVFYGGDIKGESAMKHYEDLGTQVIHTYQVWHFSRLFRQVDGSAGIKNIIFHLQILNQGPWKAPYVDIEIDWPQQVGNDKPQGKWLLYLEGLPVVESTGGSNGECTVDSAHLNPLKLNYRQSNNSKIAAALMEDPALTRRSNKSYTFAREYREKISSSYGTLSTEKKTNDEAILNRVRRDRAKIIKPEKLVDRDGKKSNIVSMVRKQNKTLFLTSRNGAIYHLLLCAFIVGL